jgi:hypothetical protein
LGAVAFEKGLLRLWRDFKLWEKKEMKLLLRRLLSRDLPEPSQPIFLVFSNASKGLKKGKKGDLSWFLDVLWVLPHDEDYEHSADDDQHNNHCYAHVQHGVLRG